MAQAPIMNEKDKQWGIIVSVLTLVLIAAYLLLASFQFADPPPQDIPLAAEMPMEEIEMENLKLESGGAGGGTPSDAPIAEPQPEVEQVITNKESKVSVKTGKSTKTNTNQNSDNSATTTVKGKNPFGGGEGGGEGGGKGPFNGPDNGKEGNGQGTTSGAGRTRYNEITTDQIFSSVEVIVKLKMTINEDGKVISATRIEGTTTTDQRIINQVMSAAKSQLKYSKEPGAGIQVVFYTARIIPN